MIELDEQQDSLLRFVAGIFGRAAERRALKRLRFWSRLYLTVSRWINPAKFDRWNWHRRAEARRFEKFSPHGD
jgi:hypothetical protein